MEVIGGIASVIGVVTGVCVTLQQLNNLREKYNHSALNIAMVASRLWSIRAALMAMDDWRKKMNNSSETSKQLDLDLSISLEACAVLVAVIDRKLKETSLDKPSVFDKLRFVALDEIFKGFAFNLDGQVGALQLLLSIYQWYAVFYRILSMTLTFTSRTLSERNERLERKETRKAIKQVQDYRASLSPEEQDLEDAASILSDDPSIHLAFDVELLDSPVYRKVYEKVDDPSVYCITSWIYVLTL